MHILSVNLSVLFRRQLLISLSFRRSLTATTGCGWSISFLGSGQHGNLSLANANQLPTRLDISICNPNSCQQPSRWWFSFFHCTISLCSVAHTPCGRPTSVRGETTVTSRLAVYACPCVSERVCWGVSVCVTCLTCFH